MSSVPNEGPLRLVEHVTCTACGCLCDDIAITADEERIVAVERACPLGERWFLNDRPAPGTPEACIDGRPAQRDEALDRACGLLKSARSPIVIGLNCCPTESVAAALALADRIRAVVDTDVGGAATARLQAFQRVGRVSATLGEVKNRADVVVFWAADPVRTHPRHFERYSVEPRGRFVPEGRRDRTVIVMDSERTATAERADLFLPVRADRGLETLWSLRALVNGVPLDASRVFDATGIELTELAALSDRLKQARYGAWFHDVGSRDSALAEAMLAVVRDLNSHTRFVILSLGAPGNPVGAESVTAWQTGIPGRVDLQLGYPRNWPGDTEAEALLARGEADLAVLVGEGSARALSASARAQLARIPRIRVARPVHDEDVPPTVGFATATSGIDAGGTVIRSDGVVLPLRPALPPRLPSDREWLDALLERFGQGLGA